MMQSGCCNHQLLDFAGSANVPHILGEAVMRYLLPLILFSIFALSTPASAQICCPAGCVQDSNRCVTTGPNPRVCNSVPCAGGGSGGGGGGSGSGTYVVIPLPARPSPCRPYYPDAAARAEGVYQCLTALGGSAQVWGCFFEDDAGRAEDRRTGLSCPARQRALTSQCRNRCERFVAAMSTCYNIHDMWQRVFGDIGGTVYGSARVDLCGPRLKSVRQPNPSIQRWR
jgi:hypothetical protein